MLGVIKQGPQITESHKILLQSRYTKEDAKNATFAIPGNKSPGPDGYNNYFYQDNWEMVGEDVYRAV